MIFNSFFYFINYSLIKIKSFLEQTSNEAIVKRQDELTVVGAIANNAYGNDLVFDYLDQNWDLLMQKYGDVSFTLPRLVESVTSKLNTRYHLEKIQRFIRDHPSAVTGVTTSAFNEAQETVGINVRWAETNFKPVVEWLEADSKPKPGRTYFIFIFKVSSLNFVN